MVGDLISVLDFATVGSLIFVLMLGEDGLEFVVEVLGLVFGI